MEIMESMLERATSIFSPRTKRRLRRPTVTQERMNVNTLFVPETIDYDGSQIRSLWAYRRCGVEGDSIVAFIGGCDIPAENIVDVQDLRAGSKIFSRKMLHFIVEHFDRDLEKAVLRQRLLAAIARDALLGRCPQCALRRKGDDLFIDDAKLSISVATLTSVSSKIHLGLNIDSKGAPVKAAGLGDLGVDAKEYAHEVLQAYSEEMAGIYRARTKVRGVE